MSTTQSASRKRKRIFFGFVVGLLVLLAISILYPALTRSRILITEADAPFNLRTFLLAISMYKGQYNSLPPNLSALGPAPKNQPASAEAADLLDRQLASGEKNGYAYRYSPSDSLRNGKFDSFTITADPISPGASKRPHYFTDATAVIRVESDRAATPTSPPLD